MEKLSVHQIWRQCVKENKMDRFKEILIAHGHIIKKKQELKKCKRCNHELPNSYFNDNKDMCYYCED